MLEHPMGVEIPNGELEWWLESLGKEMGAGDTRFLRVIFTEKREKTKSS